MKIFIATFVTVHDLDDMHDTLRDAIRNDDLETLATFPMIVDRTRVDAIDAAFAHLIDEYAECADPDDDPPPDQLRIIDYPPENADDEITLRVELFPSKTFAVIVVRVFDI